MFSPEETYAFRRGNLCFLSLKRFFRKKKKKKDYILLDVRAIFPIFATD